MSFIRKFFLATILGGLILLAFQCQPERTYIEDSDARLSFTLDTLFFDTVFTTIGTVTRSFRIKNPNSQFIKIDRISLAGGNNSVFRINVDGEPGIRFDDLEIAPRDSMYIFVEATLDPNESPDVLRIQDSVVFYLPTGMCRMWTWWPGDRMCTSYREGVIDESTTWVNDKPYLIMDYLYVDSLSSLTIDPGVKVYMHYNALLYVDGSLQVNGTQEEPVTFQGDRLEEFYQDKPGQWRFIYMSEDSHSNMHQSCKYYMWHHGCSDLRIARIGTAARSEDHELYHQSHELQWDLLPQCHRDGREPGCGRLRRFLCCTDLWRGL